MESSSAASTEKLGRELAKLITAGHEEGREHKPPEGKNKNALRAKSDESCKCKEQRSAETQPPGAPRWQASMSSLSKSAEQACDHLTERPGSGDGDDQGDADQTHRAAGVRTRQRNRPP